VAGVRLLTAGFGKELPRVTETLSNVAVAKDLMGLIYEQRFPAQGTDEFFDQTRFTIGQTGGTSDFNMREHFSPRSRNKTVWRRGDVHQILAFSNPR
jgi:hypothetical protein